MHIYAYSYINELGHNVAYDVVLYYRKGGFWPRGLC